MPGIPLPWQVVIVVSLIAGITLVLVVLGRADRRGESRDRGRQR